MRRPPVVVVRIEGDALFDRRKRRFPIPYLARRTEFVSDRLVQRLFARFWFIFGHSLPFQGFRLSTDAPGACKNFRQNVAQFTRMTDKGDVAVSVDHEQPRNHDRKTRLQPHLIISHDVTHLRAADS